MKHVKTVGRTSTINRSIQKCFGREKTRRKKSKKIKQNETEQNKTTRHQAYWQHQERRESSTFKTLKICAEVGTNKNTSKQSSQK